MASCRRCSLFFRGPARHARIRPSARLQPRFDYGGILHSPLRNYVTTLILDQVSLCARVTPLFPRLTELSYHVDTIMWAFMQAFSSMTLQDWVHSESVLWPQHLQTIRLIAEGSSPGNQLLIHIVSQLSTLTLLDLRVHHRATHVYPQQLDLTPLGRLPLLHSLTSINELNERTDTLLAVRLQFCLNLAQALSIPDLLPSLRVLHLSWERNTAEFLAQLPQLTDLRFIDRSEHGMTADHMLPLLQGLTRLTSLDFQRSKLTSNHLVQLLPRLPSLTQLILVDCTHLGSSNFLTTPTLAKTLTRLQLHHSPPYGHEMKHYARLQALTHLTVVMATRPTKSKMILWRRLLPRWANPDEGGKVLPRLVEFTFRVHDKDAFAPSPADDSDEDSDVEILRVVKRR